MSRHRRHAPDSGPQEREDGPAPGPRRSGGPLTRRSALALGAGGVAIGAGLGPLSDAVLRPGAADAASTPAAPALPAPTGAAGVNLDAAAGGQGGTSPTPLTTNPLAVHDRALHLLRRATLGFSAADLTHAQQLGAAAWVKQQLNPRAIPDTTADRLWNSFPYVNSSPPTVQKTLPQPFSWDAMYSYAQATLARQLVSQRQLFEVMVDFWANHLNVPLPSDGAWDVGPDYHNRVIRGHALTSFESMLIAACRHPGLLRALSNDQSRKESVNENLGRELLELHTVGLEARYTENDVRNSAYILTGRTVAEDGTYHYEPSWHTTGPVKVLGFTAANTSAAGGFAVGDAYLRYLARHPMTARHIARKLAIRFVSDTPSEALVAMLAATYLRHRTAIVPVLSALFATTTFAKSAGLKTRRPLENVVASMRASGVRVAAQSKGLQ